MNTVLRFVFSTRGLVAIAFLVAALSPDTATWLLGNVLGVVAPFLGPIMLIGIVFFGIRTIFRGGKKR